MKKMIGIFCFLGWMASDLHAQNSVVASGGNASGPGGTVSYSIGQLNYAHKSGSGGSSSEGVQQPYEFVTTGTGNVKDINLITVYPNPSVASVSLRVENFDPVNTSFQLYDAGGRLLLAQKIAGTVTSIPMEHFAAANYILKVTDNNKEIQSFKIIKNK